MLCEDPRNPSSGSGSVLAQWGRRKECLLLLVHLSLNGLEERRGEVALGGVRNHGQDSGAFGRLLANLQSSPDSGAAGGATKDAFESRELHGGLHGFLALHEDDLVLKVLLQAVLAHLGDEVWRPALDGVRLPRGVAAGRRSELAHHFFSLLLDAAGDQRGPFGLREDDLGLRAFLLEELPGSREGATSAIASDPIVQCNPLVLEGSQDLGTGRPLVEGRVRLRFELPRKEPSVLLRQLLGFLHHARPTKWCWRNEHLRTQCAHDLSSLDREGSSHHSNKIVTALCAEHGQGDAGVATRGLDDGAARLQLSTLLPVLDDGES
mmetsp:Transcript_133994/g.347057  ORF Transcript_133994/g.347057 Transcript_133994/m.347057 type:complete len:322 (-) Transcript_133994:219-1184(-)